MICRITLSDNAGKNILGVVISLLALFVLGCSSLRLTNMTAPTVQDPRDVMQFYCEYDMGGEELYAVKWYKDDHEFFRYIPVGHPSSVEFQVMGVHVDSGKTHCELSSCTLFLNNLSKTFSSGAYRCEVSSEAPAFRLASQTHNVTMAVIPTENPRIDGLEGSYLVGDFLNVTCISGLGDPKPILTWYIDHKPVDIKYIRDHSQMESIQEEEGIKLQRSSVQLRFPLDRQITKKNEFSSIEVACVQTVEYINPTIAPSRITKKEILVSTEDHNLKNQKLYRFFGNKALKAKANLELICTLIFLMYNCIVK